MTLAGSFTPLGPTRIQPEQPVPSKCRVGWEFIILQPQSASTGLGDSWCLQPYSHHHYLLILLPCVTYIP